MRRARADVDAPRGALEGVAAAIGPPGTMLRRLHERAQRIARGVCVACNAAAEAGVQLCGTCRVRNHGNARRRRERLLADGLCARCGVEPRDDTRSMCTACLRANAVRTAAIKAQPRAVAPPRR